MAKPTLSPRLQAMLDAMSPEAKGALRGYAQKNREELGPDWAKIKAEQMARETAPAISRLLHVLQSKVKP